MDEPAGSLLCGFAFAFDRLAKSPAFNLNAHSSNCISEVSCSFVVQVRDQQEECLFFFPLGTLDRIELLVQYQPMFFQECV